MTSDEIDLDGSIELVGKGAGVYVFINSFADLDYVDVGKRGARTLPAVIGRKASAWAAMALYAVAVCISIYLFLAVPPFMNSIVYPEVIAVVDAMMLYSGAVFAAGIERLYGQVRNVSLAGMALALVCILVSVL